METKSNSVNTDIKQKIELFLSYWKWIMLSVIVCLLIGYTHLRYADYIYKANATIKIKEENESAKLPSIEEMSGTGLFSGGSDKIKDEIQVIQSRTLIENIVKNLKLNIRCFEQGKIKEKEVYSNPPIRLSFFENDSVISTVKKVLFLKIKSSNEYLLFEDNGKSIIDRDDNEGKVYAFGDKIKTSFGGIVLIPNVKPYSPKIGSNLKITITPIKNIVNAYQKRIMISTGKGSTVLKLELKETVAQKAVDFLDQLIIEYNRDVLADKEAVVKVTSDFITNRLQRVSEDLEQVDYTAEELQKKNNLTALSAQDNLNLQSGQQLQNEIASTTNSIQLVEFLQEELDSNDKTSDMLPSASGIGDANTTQVIRSHNELVAERDRLLRNSSSTNPVVIQLNNQIETLKLNLENSLTNIKETSELTLNNLNKQNSRIRGQLYQAPTKARQFRNISRQQNIKESLYLYLLQKREESAIRLGMYAASAKIIDSAYSSYKPVAPNVTITYLASFIFGLMLPIGFIYLVDLLDTKIYQKADLVGIIDIPYLGDIPKSRKKIKVVKKVDYSPKAEAFRIIRSNIDFMLKDVQGRSKKLFVTSTKAQEGKSHTSINLAISIAYSNKSVLLIETDIRVPKILDYLELKEESKIGLTDYIADKSIKPEDIVIKHKDNAFLDIIPSGTIPPNPSELLMSERVEELFNHFESKYDYILVDTSAVGLVSDTLLISKFADMFIYVVSADGIDKRQLVHVAQTLYDEKRLPNMTMLLNSVKVSKKGYGYGYGNNPNKIKKWYNFYS